jgi:type VI protein secretion system component VasF
MMVYILHDNEFMYSVYRTVNWPEMLRDSVARTVLWLAGCALAVFAYGFCVHLLHQRFVKIVKRLGALAIKESAVSSAKNGAT